MEAKTEGTARLRLKDIITLSIFNIAMLVIMVIVKMIMTVAATPALDYLFYVGAMAFFCAPLYIVMSNKTAKRGMFFITAVFCGLMMAAFGAVWFSAVMLAVGVICELGMLLTKIRCGTASGMWCIGRCTHGAVQFRCSFLRNST